MKHFEATGPSGTLPQPDVPRKTVIWSLASLMQVVYSPYSHNQSFVVAPPVYNWKSFNALYNQLSFLYSIEIIEIISNCLSTPPTSNLSICLSVDSLTQIDPITLFALCIYHVSDAHDL